MGSILVVGSMNMDIVTQVHRLPAPGETIHGLETGFHAGGKGANQAYAASRSGAEVAMAGGLGSDSFGAELHKKLEDEGIDTGAVVFKPEATGIALITTDASGENSIILSPGANYSYHSEDIQAIDFSRYNIILLQNEIRGTVIDRVLELAEAAGIPVCMNPAPVSGFERSWLSRIELLILNEIEAVALSGEVQITNFAEAQAAARGFLAEGIPQIIITLGSKGALYMDAAGTVLEIPAYPVDAVDTTAAGDTFIGAFAAARYGGMELKVSLHYAAAAASLAVSAAGAQNSIPAKEQVIAFQKQASN